MGGTAQRGVAPAVDVPLAELARARLRLWLRLLSCVNMIETHLRGELRMRFDTTLPRFDLLSQLDQARGGLLMGELSRRLMVSNGNITGLIDRMEIEGLVRRSRETHDRRAVRVSITAQGRRAFAAMLPDHHGWVDALFSDLDAGEIETLGSLVGKLKRSVSRRNGGMAVESDDAR